MKSKIRRRRKKEAKQKKRRQAGKTQKIPMRERERELCGQQRH